MKESLQFETALSKAMALCSRTEYCSGDMRNKLQSWGVNHGDEKKIISILINENFLNDERYTKAFVRDKFRQNRWGKIKIMAHLKGKGIIEEHILKAIEEIDPVDYKYAIKNLILSHRRTIKAKNQYDLKGKLLRYGLSKGFESNILYDILNELE
jgi:regulatory protein